MDKFGIKGKLDYELRDKEGNLKDSGIITNTITDLMDAHVAERLTANSTGSIQWIALGTSTGQTSSDTDLATYKAGTFLGLSGLIQGAGGADNDAIYSGFWGAGVGTDTITEAGIFRTSGTSRTTLMTYNDGLNVAKGASDTLKIDWTLTLGSS